jgi:hypothetical protein
MRVLPDLSAWLPRPMPICPISDERSKDENE